ncbi:polysaccharide export protein [Sphingobium sufflavum]|uniref:polysaccharide biosynthesis/export family protein n=1 Tax=Sphingobium sufflavum TaxID=1129547 RepID=UPI001F3250F6|nr:polysaccharide biosynthesis/export family protein [Sphingobium sufflavum]MCE7798398.1 polysaccharide export protein [Sphingobium sufflavum]
MSSNFRSARPPLATLLASTLLVSGCATLPSSGPTGREILKSQATPDNVLGFHVVQLTDAQSLPLQPKEETEPLMPTATRDSINLLGVGDTLQVVIYEAGVSLFASSGISQGSVSDTGSAKGQTLPPITIDETGQISIPFAGRIRADGMTTYELQEVISSRLRGKSQSPQVLVSIANPVSQAVLIGGEVTRPGRIVIATGRETLWDSITLAGGYRGDPSDLIVRLTRGSQILEERVSHLARSSVKDTRILPGDRIQVYRQPLTFTAFGAPGKVDQFAFGKEDLNLIEAVARVGGSNPSAGDPSAIFVFRYVAEDGVEKPVIYYLNMKKTGSYFLAQKFAMKAQDVLYIGNARSNQPSKLIQIIGQFFSPFLMIRTATTAN